MANRFTAGNKAISECDRCGIRTKLKDLKKLVIKTKQVAIKVCNECWEEDHPQLQLGMYPVADPQAVRDPRPDFAGYAQSRSNIVPVQNFLNSEEYTSAGGEIGTVVFAAAPPPPPVACDPYFAYVSLLLHADGVNGSTTFIDNSPTPKTANVYSTAQINTSVVKYGTGSARTLGGGYLTYPSTGLSFGTGDFTLEAWVWLDAGGVGGDCVISGTAGPATPGNTWFFLIRGLVPQLALQGYYGGPGVYGTTTITTNVWHHVALCRSGNTVRIFLDGNQEAIDTSFPYSLTTYPFSATDCFGVGAWINGYAGFPGYIDDFRVTNGVARYTANFTPPTEAFPDIICAGGDPYYPSVSLLLHMDGANGGTTFTDNSPSPKTVTANGNASTNTSIVKYGTASAAFDGSGDYLSIPNNTAFELGAADFTLEGWIYLTGYSPSYLGSYYAQILNKDTLNNRGWYFFVSGSATSWTALEVTLFSNNTTPVNSSGTFNFLLNTWYYVAAVRNGTSLRFYVNGSDIGGNINSTTAQTTAADLQIGSQSPYWASQGYGYYFPGYIDDLRITKGIARYTANFTPPTGPFPNS